MAHASSHAGMLKNAEYEKKSRVSVSGKGLDNSAGTNATSAGIYMGGTAIGANHPYSLQIGQPATAGFIMGVADTVAGERAFATDCACTGHGKIS